MQSATPIPHISPALLEIMRRGVSTIVGACGRDGVPSVMRGVGVRVSEDGSDITVYLARSQSRQLLQDIADTRRVAVVFSAPTSHLTVQVKSSQVWLEDCDASADADLVAVELHPEVACDQTPGARAGAPLPSRQP